MSHMVQPPWYHDRHSRHDIHLCIFTICVIKWEIQADDHNAELKEHYKRSTVDPWHDFPVHTYNAIEQQIRECSIEKFGYFSKDELKINNGKDGFKYVIKDDDDDNDDDDHEFGNKNYSDHEGSTHIDGPCESLTA
ncbi:unnamed protein product [Aureobasidium pullulans]|nr:unnamed protein product [Aureobasidium pullulans]